MPPKSHQTACGFRLDHMWQRQPGSFLKGPTCRDAVSTPRSYPSNCVMVFTLPLQGLAFILPSSTCIFCQRIPPSWQNSSCIQTAREPGDYNWDLKRLEELFYHYIWVSRKVTVNLLFTVDRDSKAKLFPTCTLSHSTLSMQHWQLHIYNREKSRSLLTNQLWSLEIRMWLGDEWQELVHFVLYVSI